MPEYAGKAELADNVVKFSALVPPSSKRVVSLTTTRIDCDGWPAEPNHAYRVTTGLSALLRHSNHLDVNLLGSAWVQDVADELWQQYLITASLTDLSCADAGDRDKRIPGRAQASGFLVESWSPLTTSSERRRAMEAIFSAIC